MFSRSILSVFLFSVTSASLSGGHRGDLAPRGLPVAASRHAQLVARAADSVDWSSQFARWGQLTLAFQRCQSTFEAKVFDKVALEAVNQLYAKVREVTNVFAGYNQGRKFKERVIVDFKQQITRIFTSWNTILVTGSDWFNRGWEYTFRPAFERFTVLVKTMSKLCPDLGIDFRALLLGLKLNPILFVAMGVDLPNLASGDNFK